MNRKVKFIQTNNNINVREYAGPICEIRRGVWKLTPAFRSFLEQLIVSSKGRCVNIRVEFLKDKEIVVNLSDQ